MFCVYRPRESSLSGSVDQAVAPLPQQTFLQMILSGGDWVHLSELTLRSGQNSRCDHSQKSKLWVGLWDVAIQKYIAMDRYVKRQVFKGSCQFWGFLGWGVVSFFKDRALKCVFTVRSFHKIRKLILVLAFGIKYFKKSDLVNLKECEFYSTVKATLMQNRIQRESRKNICKSAKLG